MSERLSDKLLEMQKDNLLQQQRIRELEGRLEVLGDNLLAKGTSVETYREFHPDYTPPEEREKLRVSNGR